MDIPSSLLLVAMLVLHTFCHVFVDEKFSEQSPPQRFSANVYADDLIVILTAICERETVFSQEIGSTIRIA
jgi:hypothetical protein